MTTTIETTTVDIFAERVFSATLGAMQIQAVYLGDRLGWYRALAAHGPLSSPELAERTGCAERYAREWLEHQAVTGYLIVEDATVDDVDHVTVDDVDHVTIDDVDHVTIDDVDHVTIDDVDHVTVGAVNHVIVEDTEVTPTARRYRLPAAHAEVLTDFDSLAFLAPLARFVAGAGKHLDALAEAYRTGGGLSWAAMGDDLREAQGALNRPLFLHQLGQDYLPQIPDLPARLSRGGARVADVGCGVGWSAIAIAQTYPGVTVDGFDLDAPSIDAARRNAAEAGVADRVHFTVSDAASVLPDRPYDAVFAFECLHDLPDPVGVLTAMRRLAGATGIVIVMDERTEDRFTAPGSEVEQLLYGYSLICCLPDGMSTQPSAATGTVLRPETLADYATHAGFSHVEPLPLEHDFFRFYRLHH